MEPAPEDLDVQAYCRSLALQQVRTLTRLAGIAMQLAEGEGARALAAQARAAEPKADVAAVQAARAEAQEAGLAFSRFSNSVQRSLAQRARAADRLCARDKAEAPEREAARKARRDRHCHEVEHALRFMIGDEFQDEARIDALEAELKERIEELYEGEEVRVEDRPLGSVMAGLACGLGIAEEWRRWAPGWPGLPNPARSVGSEAEVEAERAFPDIDPTRIPGIRAGLAVRLQEADVIEWLDNKSTFTVADRLCRSLGVDHFLCLEDPDAPDTG
ncbi:hypothetical protein QFZ27_006981 [Inquilinus ginsengisoli]|uniref:hypothetical protein n=1 Tax=Inquilinus ginsengisoli TaxID=363840 RepID=UPI003D1B83F4